MAAISTLKGKVFSAFLFDMDGTILTSIAAAERIWTNWAQRHGLDVAAFLPTIHGMRAVDTIRALGLPGVDAEHEAAALTLAEIDDVEGISEIAGAISFLSLLPSDRWAIVTSAPRLLAHARLSAAGIALPNVLITAEDVAHGKPSPDCFMMAADRMGFNAGDCLIFEDAPAGIRAAEAAGATVVVVTATHSHTMETSHVTLADFKHVRSLNDEAGVSIGQDFPALG